LVDDLPSLVGVVCSTEDLNLLTFNIFASSNIKTFFVLNVAEVLIRISENLEPSRVGAPNLHVVGST
jgi:hypothetical protein